MDPLVVTLAGAVLTALTTAVGVLWRQSVAEGRRKDELIDRLIEKIDTLAGVQDRGLDVVERQHRRGERGRL